MQYPSQKKKRENLQSAVDRENKYVAYRKEYSINQLGSKKSLAQNNSTHSLQDIGCSQIKLKSDVLNESQIQIKTSPKNVGNGKKELQYIKVEESYENPLDALQVLSQNFPNKVQIINQIRNIIINRDLANKSK